MNILVVGAGAVGGYYGAKLALAGHAVTFVARGEHGKAIREHGLHVEAPDETLSLQPSVLECVADARASGAEVVLVAVKAGSLSDVASGVGEALARDGMAIPLLNGLDSERDLAAVIGADRVVGAVAQISSRIVAPGRIRVDAPASILLAPLAPEQMPVVERLAAEFSKAGFACLAKRDLKRVLWTKLLWNAPFNAICALTDRNAGDVLGIPELAELVRDAMRELATVASSDGVVIDDAMIEATLEATKTKFANTIPSMLQDVRAGRSTEANALQGAVTNRGAQHGIPTPIHSTLLALVIALRRTPTR